MLEKFFVYLQTNSPKTMNLFGKREEKKTEPQTQAPVQPTNVTPPSRTPRPSAQLNSQQLARTQEALRLAQTKLNNIEENLERLRDQQEWLRRYNEVQLELSQEKTRLAELNKQVSTMVGDETLLRRFEAFEDILPTFLRMQILAKASEQNRQTLLELEKEAKSGLEEWNVQQKLQQQATEKRQQTEETFYQMQDRVFQGLQIEAINETLQAELTYLEQQQKQVNEQLDTLSGSIREHESNAQTLRRTIDETRLRRQSLEMHQRMLEHDESVLLRLNRLQQIKTLQSQLRTQQAEVTKRQDNENEMLQRIYAQYQDVLSEIDTVSEEIRRQRVAVQGQTTGKLLERAMSLKSRLQMLLAAQSLWNRISAGYLLIEENREKLNSLNLHIEHNEANLRTLESETAKITRLTHEKEYTYMLSKSQNVIQLRADLVEGVSCSVCGATHHPYHSDSMLEQSKLIGEFKTEFEQLSVEMRNKQENLSQLKVELAEQKGRREVAEKMLAELEQRQTADEREWQVYASLDRTFNDCSPSTNLEARQAMLRQFIEKTTKEADAAQADLERFNFHRDAINELSERMQTLEQKKNELSTRLGEVNTGCQVMAGQADRIQQQLETEAHNYSAVYNDLERIITIPEWLHDWKINPENVKGRIQQLASQWRELGQQLGELQNKLQEEENVLSREEQLRNMARSAGDTISTHIEACRGRVAENLKTHEQTVGQRSAKVLFLKTHEELQQTQETENKEKERSLRLQHERDYLLGREENYQQLGAKLSEALATERSILDHWIRSFNQHHPPVQYSELEEVFRQERDWNSLRAKLSQLRTSHALSQARNDELNSRMVALQAEGGASAADTHSLQSSIIAQRQTLNERRSEVMLQIARLMTTLEEHQKAKADSHPETLMG